MKGVLVFNAINNVVFINADSEFQTYVNRQALEKELIEPNEVKNSIDPDVAMQLFAPLVASQRFMIGQVKDGYHTIECENGFLFVFEQYQEQIYLAVNGDGKEKVKFLHRKLILLQRVVSFLYGPCLDELRPDKVSERHARWRLISKVLNIWCDLYETEQAFLMEAVERLQVNNMLNTTCIQLLESALSGMKAAGEKHALHALLIVNSKLLALYSSRNAQELQIADILQTILMVKALFPHTQKLEDLFSKSYIERPVEKFADPPSGPISIKGEDFGEDYESAEEGDDSSDEVEYFSTPSTPTSAHTRQSLFLKEEKKAQRRRRSGGSPYPRISEQETDNYFNPSSDSERSPLKEEDNDETSLDETRTADGSSSVESDVDEVEEFQKVTAFLSTPSCKLTPHTFYCIQVMPATVLVVISEVPKAKQAGVIMQTLQVLKGVTQGSIRSNDGQQAHGKYVCEMLESNFKKLGDLTRKMKFPVIKNLLSRWEAAKQNDFIGFVNQENKTDIPPRLDSALDAMKSELIKLFKILYILPRKIAPEIEQSIQNGLERIKDVSRQKLFDYKGYLDVKAQRNVTMTSYLEDYPGLVHFIFVDRSCDQLIAPSINITSHTESGKMDTNKLIRDKIWEVVPWIQQKLESGFTSMIMRSDEFCYSYFLWFEDGGGNPITFHQPYTGVKDGSIAGILSSPFYKKIVRECFPNTSPRAVHCYELFCMHVGLVSSVFILEQSRRLASMLWETSGEASSPYSLL